MSSVIYLSPNNTHTAKLLSLKNESKNEYANSATVTIRLMERNGSDVAGATWPITMIYEEASNGNYAATIPASVNLKPEKNYKAKITAVDSYGSQGEWIEDIKVVHRN